MLEFVTIERSQDVNVQEKLSKRFQEQIVEMDAIGFSKLCESKEVCSALIPICAPLVIVMMYFRELMQFRLPLQFSTFNLTFSNAHQDTLAQICALHKKFYSFYSDGTVLLTCNIDYADSTPSAIPGFIRQNVPGELSNALRRHREKQAQLAKEGKSIVAGSLFDQYKNNAGREFRLRDLFGASFASIFMIFSLGYAAMVILAKFAWVPAL